MEQKCIEYPELSGKTIQLFTLLLVLLSFFDLRRIPVR